MICWGAIAADVSVEAGETCCADDDADELLDADGDAKSEWLGTGDVDEEELVGMFDDGNGWLSDAVVAVGELAAGSVERVVSDLINAWTLLLFFAISIT